MVSLLRRAAPRRPLFTAGGVDRYQGESDCRKQALGGDAVSGVGYGCRLTALVRGWRSAWAAAAGGGAGAAGLPFGVVGLGSEACNGPDGGWELGGLRSAQAGGFGTLPSPLLPNTFLAHTYDLPEPYPGAACLRWRCCDPAGQPPRATAALAAKERFDERACNDSHAAWVNSWAGGGGVSRGRAAAPEAGGAAACRAACDSFFEAPPIATVLGGLHPRAKRQVGERLAAAAAAHLYGGKRAAAGATLSGCAVRGRFLDTSLHSSLCREQVRPSPAAPSEAGGWCCASTPRC